MLIENWETPQKRMLWWSLKGKLRWSPNLRKNTTFVPFCQKLEFILGFSLLSHPEF